MRRSTKQLTALVRSTAPRTRSPVKRRSAKKAKNDARAYGSKARREWIKLQPSIASGKGPCVGHHLRTVANSGTGFKPDARWIVPLTNEEHHELHQHGAATFEAKYGLSLPFMAEQTELRWQAHQMFSGDTDA